MGQLKSMVPIMVGQEYDSIPQIVYLWYEMLIIIHDCIRIIIHGCGHLMKMEDLWMELFHGLQFPIDLRHSLHLQIILISSQIIIPTTSSQHETGMLSVFGQIVRTIRSVWGMGHSITLVQ